MQLLFEVATVGAVFAASLTLLDRTVGVFAALSTTPEGVRAYEGGLWALSVSPLGVRGYLRYRTASTALAALLAVIAATVITGTPDGIGWPRLGLAWLLAAACAPLVPLTTATLANNRVQGFGILKVLGIAYYLPLIGWTLYGWATLLVGALPTYWPAALAWGDHSPNTLVLTLAGSGIAALAVIVELRLGERHLLRRIQAE